MIEFSDIPFLEYETRGKWIKYYKVVCGILVIILLNGMIFSLMEFAKLYDTNFLYSCYFFGSVVLFGFEIGLQLMQIKAIQKMEIDMQKKNVFLNKINIFVAPGWLGIGAIYYLQNLTIALEAGVTSSIITIILLYLAVQVKIILEGDIGSKLELGIYFQG